MEINGKVPLFLELEFQKLEFFISSATVALLSWICAIKKNYVVFELGKLEYHATQYSSIPSSSTFKKIIIMKIQLQKLKYVTNPGQNGQIPQFLEIFSKKTLFRK